MLCPHGRVGIHKRLGCHRARCFYPLRPSTSSAVRTRCPSSATSDGAVGKCVVCTR
jgi:hypothetical protein